MCLAAHDSYSSTESRAATGMSWLQALLHRSTVFRLALRGFVLTLAAVPLTVLARGVETEMPLLSWSMVFLIVTGLVLIESILIVVMTFVFRRLH